MSEKKVLALIPFTSLLQWVQEGGCKLDENVIYLYGTPYRFNTSETEKDTELPYVKFYHRTDTCLLLSYSRQRFKKPFRSERVIELMRNQGIDDCQVQKLVLEFQDKNPPIIHSLVVAFRTKPARATSAVGQVIIKKRLSFLDMAFGKDMEKIPMTEPRQLELVSAIKDGRKLPIEEQMSTEFLVELQRRTHNIVLIKSMDGYVITKFRDGEILDGPAFRR
jgi:hypothetical protein